MTDSQVVLIEEVRQFGDILVEHTIVVAERSRRADSEDSDVVSSHLFGQLAMVLDNNGIQRKIEGDPVGFRTMLEGGESTFGAEATLFGQTVERVTFLSKAAELEVTGQTSTPLKKEEAITDNGRVLEVRRC